MTNRRNFLTESAALIAGLPFVSLNFEKNQPIFGHNHKKYTWDKDWLNTNDHLPSVKDCHEMVFTSQKNIILLTNDTQNNILIFDKKGKFKTSWGHDFPGGHGLSIVGQYSDQNLFITDTEMHQFYQTTLDGQLIKTWDCPMESEKYTTSADFIPTETAVTSDGEIYVADGYGRQYIIHYDAQGKLKNVFGGRGDEDKHLDNAHGICIDDRKEKPFLVITDRNRCCFKIFDMDGNYQKTISLPGANVCRPVIKGDYLYAAVLTSNNTGNSNSGFVIILDRDYMPVSLIGGCQPIYDQTKWLPMYQTVKLFKHPHDVLVDDEGSLYVCQWNSGQVLPYKFIPHG